MGILDILGQSLEERKKELNACNPIQIRRRKELENQLLETEIQIQEVKGRLSELDQAYKDKLKAPVSDSESIAEKRKQIQNLRKNLSVTYDEFYRLVDESKNQMKEIREIVRGIRPVYDRAGVKETPCRSLPSGDIRKGPERGARVAGAGNRRNQTAYKTQTLRRCRKAAFFSC